MYRISTFARLAGVTVKALYHYERHGLLTPRRTAAGYRRYQRRDMIGLQRILALKSLGLSLGQIKMVQSDPAKVSAIFDDQRRALADKRQRIDRADRALAAIQEDADPGQALERFVGEAAWDRAEATRLANASPMQRAPDRVAPSKLALFHDIEAALDTDPEAAAAHALLARWDALVEQETGGDPTAVAMIRKAWANWHKVPQGMRNFVASLYDTDPATLERVFAFIWCSRASLAS